MNVRNQNKKKFEKKNRRLDQLIRKNCCWNCLQIGHLRFQCPYPKTIRCSFCRKPFVLTINCNCRGQNTKIDVPEHQRQESYNHCEENLNDPTNHEYSVSVVVPVKLENGSIHSVIEDNIVVFIDNSKDQEEEDKDILEIHAETDSLNEL